MGGGMWDAPLELFRMQAERARERARCRAERVFPQVPVAHVVLKG